MAEFRMILICSRCGHEFPYNQTADRSAAGERTLVSAADKHGWERIGANMYCAECVIAERKERETQ